MSLGGPQGSSLETFVDFCEKPKYDWEKPGWMAQVCDSRSSGGRGRMITSSRFSGLPVEFKGSLGDSVRLSQNKSRNTARGIA